MLHSTEAKMLGSLTIKLADCVIAHRGEKGDVYDFMLFFNPYIEIILQELKTFKEKHKIIDVPYFTIPSLNYVIGNSRRYCTCDLCHILYNQQFIVLSTGVPGLIMIIKYAKVIVVIMVQVK